MPTVSSLGVGSGLELNALLEGLVNAERVPTEARLNAKERDLDIKLSSYATIKAKLEALKSSMTTLNDISSFEQARTLSIGDSDKISAEITGDAAESSYQIEVEALARSHVLYTNQNYATTNTVVGEGTLTFRYGTSTYDGVDVTAFTPNATSATFSVTIDSSNSTLSGIRDAINNAEVGVTASIINDGGGYELVFRSNETGVEHAMDIAVTQTSGNLNALTFDEGVGNSNMQQSVAGTNAAIEVDGIDITNSSNDFSQVIDGVTLTALETMTAGTTTSLTITNDKDLVRTNIDAFVTAYNDLISTMDGFTSYNEDTEISEPLAGDSTIRSIASQVRNAITAEVGELNDAYDFLFNIGITTSSTGTLTVDSDELDEALEDDLTAVARLFAIAGSTTDAQATYNDYDEDDSKTGTYALNITQLATQGTYVAANYANPAGLTINGDNDTFVLKVDGVESGTISLTQQVYGDFDALALEIQSRINADSNLQNVDSSVTVTSDGSKFTITSARYGSASNIEFTTVDTDTAAELGFSVSAGTAGLDVAGTINGAAATGAGQILQSSTGDSKGLSALVSGGALGARGNLSFSRGLADGLMSAITDLLDTDNVVEARISGLNERKDLIQEQRDALDERILALEERLRKQFTALDILVSQFNATGNYLSQQLSTDNKK